MEDLRKQKLAALPEAWPSWIERYCETEVDYADSADGSLGVVGGTRMMKVRRKKTIAAIMSFAAICSTLVYWFYWEDSARLVLTERSVAQPSHLAETESKLLHVNGYIPLQEDFTSDPKREGYGSYLKGQVLSSNEQPIPGANVFFYSSRDPGTQRFGEARVALSTDSQGCFELAHPELLGGWLVVEKAGFASIEEAFSFAKSEMRERTYFLEPASSVLQGVVRDGHSGMALPGASIFVSFTGVNTGDASMTVSMYTTSDAKGRFVLHGLKAGTLMVTASVSGYFTSGLIHDLPEGNEESVEILLAKGEERLLRVRNQDGEPVPDAIVTTIAPSGSPPDFYRGNQRGEVTFLIAPGRESVEAEVLAPGYVSKRISLTVGLQEHEVLLERARPLTGRVLSESDKPVWQARVFVWGQLGQGLTLTGQGEASTDQNGYFSLYPKQRGVKQLFTTHNEYLPEIVDIGEGTGDDLQIRLRRPEGGITGRVLKSSGTPVTQFALLVKTVEPKNGSRFLVRRFFSNLEGRFEILELPAGTLQVEVIDAVTGIPETIGLVTVLKGQVAEFNIIQSQLLGETGIR